MNDADYSKLTVQQTAVIEDSFTVELNLLCGSLTAYALIENVITTIEHRRGLNGLTE